MIVVRLRHGLGNQMFQYALGRALAHRHGDGLFLETSALESTMGTPRQYGLDGFAIDAKFITLDQAAARTGITITVSQNRRGFQPEVLDVPSRPCLVLNGLWLSERYFDDARDHVRRDFTFKRPAEPALADAIRGTTAVGVHVRRGDYVAGAGEHLGLQGLDYYQRAAAFIAERVPAPHFFVFSDDPAWCAANLQLGPRQTVVDHQDTADADRHRDLQLMSLCRHFVIANSTFSWWGAWLGTAPDRIVVAPHRWYRDDPRRTEARDLIPPGWNLL